MKKKFVKKGKEIVATPNHTLCPECKLPLKTQVPRNIHGTARYFCANEIDKRKCMADVTHLIVKKKITVIEEG